MEAWRSCRDRLPERDIDVLVYSESTGEYAVAAYSAEGHWMSDSDSVDGSVECSVVSHWMELPPPPQ